MTRKIGVATGGVALVLLLAFWFLAWRPASNQLHSAQKRLSDAHAMQGTLRSRVATLKSEQAKAPTYRAELAALQAAVPSSPSLANIIDQLTAGASASGVTLPSVAPTGSIPAATGPAGGPSHKGPALATVTLTVGADGSYPQLIHFINFLNSSPRLFVVRQVTMDSGSGGKLAASLMVQAFYTASSTGGA